MIDFAGQHMDLAGAAMPCWQEEGISIPASLSTARIDFSGGTVSVTPEGFAYDLEVAGLLIAWLAARLEPLEADGIFGPCRRRSFYCGHQAFRTATVDRRILAYFGKLLRHIETGTGFAAVQ